MPDANGNLVKRIDMATHFAEICSEHGITVKFTTMEPGEGAYWARPSAKLIQTRPIKNTGFYVSGLHEVGHCVGKRQNRNRWSVLMSEWFAWKWAKENAIVWTDTAERVMVRALTGYRNSATADNVFAMPQDFHQLFETGE